MSNEATVRVEVKGDFAHVIFDQPNSRANTLTTTVWNDLSAAIDIVGQRTDVRGAILSSAKDGIFVAGADLKELYGMMSGPENAVRELLGLGLRVLESLESLPIPTVAVIDGAALGGGMEVALACEYRIVGSHPKCKMGLPEVKLGLIPGWGGTQRLPRIVGIPASVEMLISGRAFSALESFAVGLADENVPSNQLIETATTVLARADWDQRREKKRQPVKDTVSVDWSNLLSQLSDDERPAAEAAIRVVGEGAGLELSQATAFETDAFVPLLFGPAARRRIEGFLKK
jgi:enoyl-CoA hydratase/carnithine racemase